MRRKKKKYAKEANLYTKIFSERSGMPFKMKDMVREPGTGLIVHRNESDEKWNREDWNGDDPEIPSDAQELRFYGSDPNAV